VRDYIHVSDLAAAHVDALAKLIETPGESYVMNCGYGRGFSVLEVLDAVDRVTNMKIKRKLEPRRPGDPDALVANNAKILATLPWRPQRDNLDTIVADALAWERKLAERS
jgi:UDP-glucose 4-epimerase